MSRVEMFRVVVNERLTAAAEEIFGLFERTMAECEAELSCSKRENERQRKLLDAVLKPEVRLHRAVQSPDVQQDTDPPHTKEVQDQQWSRQEGVPPLGSVPVKSEHEVKAQPSQLKKRHKKTAPSACTTAQQMEEENGEMICGGLQQDVTVKVKDTQTCASVSQPARHDHISGSSEPEAENGDDDRKETNKPQLDRKTLTNCGIPKAVKGCNTGKKSLNCSKCGKTFAPKDCVQSNGKCQGKKLFVCSVCVQISTQSSCLVKPKTQSGKKIFSCLVCKKQFSFKGDAVRHVRIHTGEKPFACSVCGKKFTQSTGLCSHMRTHTGEKPYGCSLCPKRFIRRGILARHMRVHTGEKPYSCSECNSRFSLSQSLLKHMRLHTGEKPFSCSVCDKKFTQKGHLTQHMTLHTGEKSFTCPVCDRKFTRQSRLKKHKCNTESNSS